MSKSNVRWLAAIITCAVLVVGAIVIATVTSEPRRQLDQRAHLAAIGIHDNRDYPLVPITNQAGTETRHFWAMPSGQRQVRFAIIIDGKRVPIDYDSHKINWVEQAGTKTPVARLFLVKGEKVVVNSNADLWDKNAGDGTWRERIRYYQRRPGGTPLGAIVARDAYNITITVSPQTFNHEVLPLRGA